MNQTVGGHPLCGEDHPDSSPHVRDGAARAWKHHETPLPHRGRKRSVGRTSSTAGAGRETGETLTEVLVTMVILTTAIVAILTALLTVVRTTALNKEKTRSSVAVQSAIERMAQPVDVMEYVPCGSSPSPATVYQQELSSYLQGNIDPSVAAYSITVQEVRFASGSWGMVGDEDVFNPTRVGGLASFSSTCPENRLKRGHERDGGVQEVTLKVASPPSAAYPVDDTLIVVKRDARCPDEPYPNVDAGPC